MPPAMLIGVPQSLLCARLRSNLEAVQLNISLTLWKEFRSVLLPV